MFVILIKHFSNCQFLHIFDIEKTLSKLCKKHVMFLILRKHFPSYVKNMFNILRKHFPTVLFMCFWYRENTFQMVILYMFWMLRKHFPTVLFMCFWYRENTIQMVILYVFLVLRKHFPLSDDFTHDHCWQPYCPAKDSDVNQRKPVNVHCGV